MKAPVRWAVLTSAIAAIVVLFVLLQPGGGEEPGMKPTSPARTRTTSAEATGASPTPTSSPTPPGVEIEVDVEDGRIQGRAEYAVSVGDRVRLEVEADVADHVHVHGYDLLSDVAPGRPAVISFRADAPGVFEVELEDAGRLLFRLRVTP